MPLTPQQAKDQFSAFIEALGATHAEATALIPGGSGKLYEAWSLKDVVENLIAHEGFTATHVGGPQLHFRAGGGPISDAYPHVLLTSATGQDYNLWTDIRFTTKSADLAGETATQGRANNHELDLVLVQDDVDGYPTAEEIHIAVECKDRSYYTRALAREALGVRREMGLLDNQLPTIFNAWPRPTVPNSTQGCMLVYANHTTVEDFQHHAGDRYGIDFIHLDL